MICPRAKRLTRKSLKLAAGLVLCSTTLFATELKKAADAPLVTPPEVKDEIAAYTQKATEAANAEKWPMAEHYLQLIVDLPAAEADKKAPYLTMAATFQSKHLFSKAIAVYEKMLAVFPQDPDVPETLLKVGYLYREIGAQQLAISRFYSVLNTALKVDGHGFEDYKALTRKAQWEIAETY